jgi:hypothetical protein
VACAGVKETAPRPANSSYGKLTNFAGSGRGDQALRDKIDRCGDTVQAIWVAPQSCESYVERLRGQQKSPGFALAISGGFEDAR